MRTALPTCAHHAQLFSRLAAAVRMKSPVRTRTPPTSPIPIPVRIEARCFRFHTVGRCAARNPNMTAASRSPTPVCVSTIAWKSCGSEFSPTAKNSSPSPSASRFASR